MSEKEIIALTAHIKSCNHSLMMTKPNDISSEVTADLLKAVKELSDVCKFIL